MSCPSANFGPRRHPNYIRHSLDQTKYLLHIFVAIYEQNSEKRAVFMGI
jgi:hypothetical protein